MATPCCDAADGAHRPSQGGDTAFVRLLLSSHRRLTGRSLCPSGFADTGEAVRWLYEAAPFGLLAHGTGPDPVFVYANTTAQKCFEYGWAEFVRLPSRLSAVLEVQGDREAFVRSVTERGFASGYRGLRVAKSGRSFWIEDVTMWNLADDDGAYHGQAAVFQSWTDVREG
ncbi:MEKHLA domain-containing protein [Streptomyces sp. NPDC058256]|uniref:MEKHLA domain-containing protein n=1 Tax=Streptomyces sp. NPDC058256 TaxID=3346408 RepID=UPI0036EE3114